jgi:hypothetical protein
MNETSDNTKTNTYEQEPTYSLYKELPSILIEESKKNSIPFISSNIEYLNNLGKQSEDNDNDNDNDNNDNDNDNNDVNKKFYKKLFYFFLFVFVFYIFYKLFLESNDEVLTGGGTSLVKINEFIPPTILDVPKIDELINVTDLITVSDIPIKINNVVSNTNFSLKINPTISPKMNPNIDQITQLFDAFKL